MENEEINPLTKKERNELRRAEKQQERDRRVKMKKFKSALPWFIFAGLVIASIYGLTVMAQKSKENRPGEPVAIMGADHMAPGETYSAYNSNPPTSGPHAGPVPWGFNEQEIADEDVIHNLEHGGIWITYKDLDAEAVATLEAIAKRNSRSVVVSPRAANDSPVAVVSWGRIMKLDAVDEARITEFIRKNKNKSPERIAI